MAEEKTLRKPGEGGQAEGTDKVGEVPENERSEKRFEDLTHKLTEQETRHAAELAAQKEKIANLEFESSFKDVVHQYPHAAELKDKIRERVKAGLPVSEAAVLILHQDGKLQKREEMEQEHAQSQSLGGSTDTQPPKGKKRPEEMTTEELREALVEEQNKGTFRYDPD